MATAVGAVGSYVAGLCSSRAVLSTHTLPSLLGLHRRPADQLLCKCCAPSWAPSWSCPCPLPWTLLWAWLDTPNAWAELVTGQEHWQGPFTAVSVSAQIWPPVQIANFYFVPLKHR